LILIDTEIFGDIIFVNGIIDPGAHRSNRSGYIKPQKEYATNSSPIHRNYFA